MSMMCLRLYHVVFAMLLLVCSAHAGEGVSHYVDAYVQAKYNKVIPDMIYVGVQRQKLYLVKNNALVKVYTVSTSRYGCGQETGSEKTPLGLHKIAGKTGKGFPMGGIIKGSAFSGKIATIEHNAVSMGRDELTTRAMRLTGIEPGLNQGGKNDSFKREIYIHGTPEEGLIGTPSSHGCIRMRNADVAELFDMVREQLHVLILDN